MAPADGVAASGEEKELRLAVVCYGGVSLAIYMHGMTKEINRLVRASALPDAAGEDAGSEGVYRELLRERAAVDPDRARTRVVVDVVTGTSAGGINGVYLAKAVAHNRSQQELRNLWLGKGDIGLLLHGPTWLPWRLRIPGRLLRIRRKAPLHGDSISEWLFDALDSMDRQSRAEGELESLMPAHHGLQLFVTMTDFYGYPRDVILTDLDPHPNRAPTPISDWRHRHVLEFRYGQGRDDFGPADNPALAFSARATSSFPGAFPPVSFKEFEGYLRRWNVTFPPEFDAKYFRVYGLSEATPREAFFVDGGVLDNKPFGHALDAIRRKAASVEVDRRLLYLEPDPGGGGKRPKQSEPGTLATVLGAVSGIPRKEPLLEDLLGIATLNDRVQRVRDIIETSFDGIAERVRTTVGQPLDDLTAGPGLDRLGDWIQKVNDEAAADSGFGYATYVRLKIVGVVDRYARAVCASSNYPDDCDQSFFVRGAIRAWAEQGDLFEKVSPPSEKQIDFLRGFDLEYGERRLKFVIAGLNWYYRDRARGEPDAPERTQLDALKARLWAGVDALQEAVAASRDDEALAASLGACFAEKPIAAFVREHGFTPARFAATYRDELDRLSSSLRMFLRERLQAFTADLYRDLDVLTEGWAPKRRADLLVRFLGFPFWDVLLYPIQALADAGERDHVDVVRMSPRDATLLGTEGEAKLHGVRLGHFGAFFDRGGRENDYLWGRLDAAERLVETLLGKRDDRFERWCVQAFDAIIAEEAKTDPPLPEPLLGRLRERVAAARAALA